MKICTSDGVHEEYYYCQITCPITKSILRFPRERLRNNERCFCCHRDCSNRPSLTQYTCTDGSDGHVICCTNTSITASTSQQTLFSSNMKMITSLSHSISSFPLSAMSKRMSSQEKVYFYSHIVPYTVLLSCHG